MGGGKGSTSTSTMKPPPEIMEAYKKSLGMAEQAISRPYEGYGGQLVAGMNQNQQQAISNVNAAQGMALPYIQQGAQFTNLGAQGVTPGLINQFMSPYLSNVVGATQANILESNAQQQSAMKAGAIQAGAFGGDRSRVGLSELARQQGLAGSQAISGLLNQGYGQALGAAQGQVQNYFTGGNQLANLGNSAQQSVLQGAQALMGAGTQQQQTDQAGLEAQYQQFLQRLAYPYQNAQFFANVAQGIGAGAGGTSATTTPGPSPFSQILGAGVTLASMSDRRMKDDIHRIGKTNDGQPIYSFKYKGSPKTQIGLMAQDVEKRNPDAVTNLGGIKMVDYDKATEGARMGKNIGGAVRGRYAQGGLGMIPYADFVKGMYGIGYTPDGALAYGGHKPGSTLPSAPEGYKDQGLDPIFEKIQGFDEDQKAKFLESLGDFGSGLGLSPASDGAGGMRAPAYNPNGLQNLFGILPFSTGGGVVPRQKYQTGGSPFDRSVERTLEFEGGLLPEDTNGTPTNFGINQKANPDVDVLGITQDDARRLYKERYWNAINGDELAAQNPDLAHVAFDTAVISGPSRAKAMLEASGGDPNKFMQLRDQFLDGLVAKNPEKYGPFAKAWDNRNQGLLADISADVPASSGLGGLPDTPSGGVVVEPAVNTPDREEENASRSLLERVTGMELSSNARRGLLAAGLGMMAGTSPFAAVNIGRGGASGLQTYLSGVTKEMEAAKMGEEAAKIRAEAGSISQGSDIALQDAYFNYNIALVQAGKKPLSFAEYVAMLRGKNAVNTPSVSTTDDGNEEPPPPPPASGGDPDQVGTLNYWQVRMNRAQDSLVYAKTDAAKAMVNGQIATAQENINKITSSPFYVAAQNAAQKYQYNRDNLITLGELNASFMGGRGSKNVANLVGIAKKLGIVSLLPQGWQDEDEKYDLALKIATEMAIQDAQSSGLLRAPGAALEAEERVTPVPDMAPEARYALIKKQLALLERNNELYAGWDTSPDVNGYIRQFDSDPNNAMENYMQRAEEMLPTPQTTAPTPVPRDTQDELNRLMPDAVDGTIANGRGGEKLEKQNGVWVRVQ